MMKVFRVTLADGRSFEVRGSSLLEVEQRYARFHKGYRVQEVLFSGVKVVDGVRVEGTGEKT